MHPFLADKLDTSDSIPILREKLIEFTEEIAEKNPGFRFDLVDMNQFERINLWFLDILQNHELAQDLLS